MSKSSNQIKLIQTRCHWKRQLSTETSNENQTTISIAYLSWNKNE